MLALLSDLFSLVSQFLPTVPSYLLSSPIQVYDSDYLNCQPALVSTLSLSRLQRQRDCWVKRTVWRLLTVRQRMGCGFRRGKLIHPLADANDGENTTDGMRRSFDLSFPPQKTSSPVCWDCSRRGLLVFSLLHCPMFYFMVKKMCTPAHMHVCSKSELITIWSLFQPVWICSESTIDLSWWYFGFWHTYCIFMTVVDLCGEEAACCFIDLVSHAVSILSALKTTEKSCFWSSSSPNPFFFFLFVTAPGDCKEETGQCTIAP